MIKENSDKESGSGHLSDSDFSEDSKSITEFNSNSDSSSKNDNNKKTESNKSFDEADISLKEEAKEKFISDLQKILSPTKYINYEVDLNELKNFQEIGPTTLILPNMKHIYIQSISLPPTLQIIKRNAFKKWYFLDQIIFLKDKDNNNFLNYIGKYAFSNTKLQSIIIPDNIQEIQSNCFPRTLKSIEFENGTPSLNIIGNNFLNHAQIESISMPSNTNAFIEAKNIFLMCKNLTTIKFDKYANSINYEEDEKKDIEKMNEENKIIQSLFSQWIKFSGDIMQFESNKKQFEIDGKIGVFKTNDFAKSFLLSQTSIQNLEIFNSNLNKFYFFNTPNLINISLPKSDNCRYIKIDGCLYSKNLKKLIVAERNIKSAVINSKCKIITNYALSFESLEKVAFEEKSELEEISFFVFSQSQIKDLSIPNTVKRIDYGAFYKCNKLESCNLPNLLNYLDFCTFSYSNLTEITIPKNVVKIGYGCFFKCFNLKKVIFENNSKLIEIDDFVFAYTNIETISIPKTVTKIGNNCFVGCNKLKSVNFDKESKFHDFEWDSNNKKLINKEIHSISKIKPSSIIIKDGLHYQNFGDDLVNFDFSVQKLIVTKNIKKIKQNALKFSNINKIEFEPGCQLKIIEASAFESLHIQEIFIPNSVTIIEDFAFCCCRFLKIVNIDMKSQLTKIGNHAFEETSIETINLPSTLTTVGDYAFYECIKLRTVINQSKKIDFGYRSFSKSSIEIFKFPQEIVFHESSFSECLKLYHLTFIDEPTKIIFEENSFAMSGLIDLDLKCICEISENAFAFCKSLKKVQILRKESIIHQNSFYNSKVQIFNIKCKITNIKYNDYNCYIEHLEKVIKPLVYRSYQNNKHCGYFERLKKLFSNKKSIKCYGLYKKFSNYLQYLKLKNASNDIFMYGVFLKSMDDWFYLTKIYKNMLDFDQINLKVYYTDQNDKNKSFIHEYFLSQEYHIINGALKYVNSIDNISLIEKPEKESSENEIKKNEIIKVSNIVKKFDFDAQPHIKKIVWEPDCIVEYLGPPGFFSYSNLIEIIIPKFIDLIPHHLFERCNFLKTVLFEKNSILREIGEFSFANTKIETIELPKTVKIIHKSAFMDTISLKNVSFYGTIIEDEVFTNTGIISFTIPNKTKSIGNSAFRYCRSLKKVMIDIERSNLSNIGSYAFAETSITRIDIPSKIEIINEGAFSGCVSLKEVNIAYNSNLKKIMKYSFVDNSLLDEINIPYNRLFCKNKNVF